MDHNIITFNVSGQLYSLYFQSIKLYPQCLLWKLACEELHPIKDSVGNIFINRNPQIFAEILNLLQYGKLLNVNCDQYKEMLLIDLQYYNLSELIPLMDSTPSADNNLEQSNVNDSDVTDLPMKQLLIDDDDEDDPVSSNNSLFLPQQVELNVGGVHYTTSIMTLTQYPDSMLGSMFSGKIPPKLSADGRIFIDRDGKLFRHVLNFMRNGGVLADLPSESPDLEALSREADFYQIRELVLAVDKLKHQCHSANGETGIYLEVKDSVICFRGFHITTSLIGPMQRLAKFSPFLEEFQATGQAAAAAAAANTTGNPPPLWCNINPFYTAWTKGGIEEVYLNSDGGISRLEWATKLRQYGWQLVNTCSCCSSLSDQTLIVVDKWYLPGHHLAAAGGDVSSSSTDTDQQQPATTQHRVVEPQISEI